MQKYKIKRTLGVGTFGAVFQAISPSQQIVAIKKFKRKYSTWDECCTLREIKSLKKLDHPNIIKLKEVILANGDLYLVFDYLETNLLQVYSRALEANRRFTEAEVKSIFFKMLQGLSYLHKNGYFHRDLKPQNILCHNLDVKICDFGLARQIRSMPPFTDYVSTRWYRAPELLFCSSAYNSPVDIWALACIVVELYTMQPLFPGDTWIQCMNKIVHVLGTPKKTDWPEGFKMASALRYDFSQSKGEGLFEIMHGASVELVELLQSMLCYSSRKRPSANQILKHPYFANFSSKSEEKANNEHEQLKVSFYDKNIVQIPKNVKIQNPRQIEMRKSLYKFGDSFSSSFHKEPKQQKQQKTLSPAHEKIKKQTNFSEKKVNASKKGKFLQENDADINKRFDEMEEIIQQLKKKQEMKNTNSYQKVHREKTDREFQAKEKEKDKMFEQKMSVQEGGYENEQLRMRMYSISGGMNPTKSISSIKAPLFKGTLLGNNYKNV